MLRVYSSFLLSMPGIMSVQHRIYCAVFIRIFRNKVFPGFPKVLSGLSTGVFGNVTLASSCRSPLCPAITYRITDM